MTPSLREIHSYVVFDFETTGLDPQSDHIIQVGLCTVKSNDQVTEDGWLVNQNITVPSEATAIHGIDTDAIRSRGLQPKESLTKLLVALREAPICVGHNIHRFDVPFLIKECRRLEMIPPDTDNFIDTAVLFKGWKLGMPKRSDETFKCYSERALSIRMPGLLFSVPACLMELRFQADSSKAHDASHDAYMTHLIFHHLQKVI